MVVIVLAAAAYVVFAFVRSMPAATVTGAPAVDVITGRSAPLAWPRQGQAAIAVEGAGLIASHNAGAPAPIASVTKVMTAYLILRDHPLPANGNGPRITVTAADMAAYRADLASGQSVVAVRARETLSERQALEGLLLPSGNNIATMLARWDAGKERAFVARMNATARALGLTHTRYTSASGVQDSNVSTAVDQTRLGMQAIEIPAFARIVAMPRVTLPIAGPQATKDALVGTHGIFGIKPGTTSHAGGCFVFAAHQRIAGQLATLVGAVLHQAPGQLQPVEFASVFHATTALLASSHRVLVTRRLVRRGATLALMRFPWTSPVGLQAASAVSLVAWPGLRVHTRIATAPHLPSPVAAGQDVGSAVIRAGGRRQTVALVAARAVPRPSLGWRLTHP